MRGCPLPARERPAAGRLFGWREDRAKILSRHVVQFAREHPLLEALGDAAAFYHVHSYVARPGREDDVLGRGDYGGPFVSIVGSDRIFGAQFHPEKSSTAGLRLLANFSSLCTRTPA